jgi:hypothetical protein
MSRRLADQAQALEQRQARFNDMIDINLILDTPPVY